MCVYVCVRNFATCTHSSCISPLPNLPIFKKMNINQSTHAFPKDTQLSFVYMEIQFEYCANTHIYGFLMEITCI